jgi:hypothetical protein
MGFPRHKGASYDSWTEKKSQQNLGAMVLFADRRLHLHSLYTHFFGPGIPALVLFFTKGGMEKYPRSVI